MDRITAEVASWPGVTTELHRFGGTEFILGGREIGHVHRHGLVDIPYTRQIHDQLLAEGKTSEHHILPESTWTSYWVKSDNDMQQAIWLFRVSYLRHLIQLSRHPERHEGLPQMDLSAEIDALQPSNELHRLFIEMQVKFEWSSAE